MTDNMVYPRDQRGTDQHTYGSPSQTQRYDQQYSREYDPLYAQQDPAVSSASGVSSDHGMRGSELICGPMLRYTRTADSGHGYPLWFGSVLVVMRPGVAPLGLRLRCEGVTHGCQSSGPANGYDGGNYMAGGLPTTSEVSPVRLYEDRWKVFWRYDLEIPLQEFDAKWEYELPGAWSTVDKKTGAVGSRHFFVPSQHESMRILFHSCNGFSVGTDVNYWSGLALWAEVWRIHEEKPFHVMIGGGDQIYNDEIRVNGPLQEWAEKENPHQRRHHPFDDQLKADCDSYYYNNYVTWFSTEPFATANGQIPQINIWDDHDIIDGYGSYTDHFMKTSVFLGIGAVAFKYYMLFQHHTPPPPQEDSSYIMPEHQPDPSWILGHHPGPYIHQHSRSIFTKLGKRVAFLGVDARTERTRHQINYPETYDLIFSRLHSELSHPSGLGSEIKHLIILLGVPIAYPRLVWLENILSSPIIGPIRFLNKRFGIATGFFNNFDGAVDLLDDLDDHYCARQHKKERNEFILRLQRFSFDHSIRITILGGDVHLAAVGRFYSSPRMEAPTIHDHRYIVNVISSAITNKPPPAAVANMLSRRNKIHHLGKECDETLLDLWDKDPGGVGKSAGYNRCTMPSRNFAIISESGYRPPSPNGPQAPNGNGQFLAPPNAPLANGGNGDSRPVTATSAATTAAAFESTSGKDGHSPLHPGEENAGSTHPAATGVDASGMFAELGGGLDVCYRVEIDPQGRRGATEGYAFTIPPLVCNLGSLNGAATEKVQQQQRSQTQAGPEYAYGG